MTTEAERARGERIRRGSWGAPEDRAVLQQLADEIAARAGFAVCAIEVLRSDAMLEFVAIHGSPEGAERLMGQGSPLEAMTEAFNCGAKVGIFTFVAAEWMTESAFSQLRTYGHVPDLPAGEEPHSWRAEDMLAAHLYDEEGRLRSLIYLDEPLSGHRPSEDDLRRLDRELRMSFRAVLTTVEREAYAQQVRLADAARHVIRAATDQLPISDLLDLARLELRRGFRAARLYVQVYGDGPESGRSIPSRHVTDEVYEAGERALQLAWLQDCVVIVERDDVWGADGISEGCAQVLSGVVRRSGANTLVLVPIGGGGRLLGTIVIVRGQSDVRWTDSESTAALDVGRDLGRAILNARAFEREQELNAELRRLDEYRAELIRTMSHELKNPIGVILGHVEILESLPDLPSRATASLQAMERGASRLQRLADDLLVLSRLGNPDHPLQLEHVDLDTVLRETAEFLEVLADQHEVAVEVLPPTGATVVLGDTDELHRLAVNLASNAIKYSRPDGVVQLSAAADGGEVVLTVADEGLGISEADQERLFVEFFRSTNTEALRRSGTGLGLAIARRVVGRHGGRIDLESTLGVGTTFRVHLPLTPPAAEAT